jgi:hypothetical protein
MICHRLAADVRNRLSPSAARFAANVKALHMVLLDGKLWTGKYGHGMDVLRYSAKQLCGARRGSESGFRRLP